MNPGLNNSSPIDAFQIIPSLIEKLRENYIFPEMAEQICHDLQEHLRNGDYNDIHEGELFALALTMHLQELNHDEHLWVRWHEEPLPESEDQLRLDPEWQAKRNMEARLDNYGIHKLERLPGNVGLIEITYFHRPEWGGDTVAAAMNFLADTEALIFDLRQCTGGYPGMITLFSSYLFGETPFHLSSIYWRDEDFTQQYWTLPYVPGRRFIGKLVFVLTSKVTFSGGEEFAYDLQALKRATVVGEKTDGGAHSGASYRLAPHFEAFIPIGRAINPITGTNWQGFGVIPDISIPQVQAFKAAYYLALKSIIARCAESPSGPNMATAEEAQNAIHDLASNLKFCSRCGYQNPLYRVTCKNCDELLPITD